MLNNTITVGRGLLDMYLVMSKRYPVSHVFYPWPDFDKLRSSINDETVIPSKWYDKALVEAFITTMDELTPSMDELYDAGYIDYRREIDRTGAIYTCMMWESQEKHDAYYGQKEAKREAYHAARDALLAKFNLALDGLYVTIPEIEVGKSTLGLIWEKNFKVTDVNDYL